MNHNLTQIKSQFYDKYKLIVSEFREETESKEYYACRFKLNGVNIISRDAKITPKKMGQFVTFWKRHEGGWIEPFHQNDEFDFFVVNVHTESKIGQFVFPKSILLKKGIISTKEKEGKRAFRVYPIWDIPNNKQAERTKEWQLDYFHEINEVVDFEKVFRTVSQ